MQPSNVNITSQKLCGEMQDMFSE